MKKRIIYLLIFSLFLIPSIVKADNLTKSVDKEEKIYDFADLITNEEEKEIQLLLKDYIDKNKLDLIIVTLDENPYGNTSDDTHTYHKN